MIRVYSTNRNICDFKRSCELLKSPKPLFFTPESKINSEFYESASKLRCNTTDGANPTESFFLPTPREFLLLLAVRPEGKEVHVHAEGDELDEEEHVGDGDARQEAVDGRTVHLLACEHGDVEQVLGCYSVVS